MGGITVQAEWFVDKRSPLGHLFCLMQAEGGRLQVEEGSWKAPGSVVLSELGPAPLWAFAPGGHLPPVVGA